MSGPNPPGPDSEGADDLDQEPGEPTAEEDSVQDATGETEIHSRAYSAPESEQFTAGPYVPADPELYDYDEYDKTELVDAGRPPRWPWVVGVVAIIAAISLVVSVSLLVMGTDSDNLNAQGGVVRRGPRAACIVCGYRCSTAFRSGGTTRGARPSDR